MRILKSRDAQKFNFITKHFVTIGLNEEYDIVFYHIIDCFNPLVPDVH